MNRPVKPVCPRDILLPTYQLEDRIHLVVGDGMVLDVEEACMQAPSTLVKVSSPTRRVPPHVPQSAHACNRSFAIACGAIEACAMSMIGMLVAMSSAADVDAPFTVAAWATGNGGESPLPLSLLDHGLPTG